MHCRHIAQRQEISDQYLSQLLLKLRRAGLVESTRGPGGGYALARDATEISAADVLRAVEESLNPVDCIDREGSACARADGCPTQWLWEQLDVAIHQVLDSVTVADLRERAGTTQTIDVSLEA